jgi:hypothetical protein
MMRKVLLLLILMGFALPSFAMELSGGLGGGFVGMGYLNEQLEVLTARQEAEFSPIRQAWGVQFAVWPWSQLGVGVRVLSASGAVHNRMSERLSSVALGIEACGRFRLPIFGRPLRIEGGLGVYGAALSGIMSGKGLGFGGYASVGLPIFALGGLRLNIKAVLQYLPFYSIRDGQEVIAPVGVAAIDYSGFFIGLDLLLGR